MFKKPLLVAIVLALLLSDTLRTRLIAGLLECRSEIVLGLHLSIASALIVLIASVTLAVSFVLLIGFLERREKRVGPLLTRALNRFTVARTRAKRPKPLSKAASRLVADIWDALRGWRKVGLVVSAFRWIARVCGATMVGAVKPDLFLWAQCMLLRLLGAAT